jgi:hypothetical protein
MKLKHFEHKGDYRFLLVFENGETQEADLKELLADHLSLDAVHTARIDADWGRLEFNNGMVDIEPKTLYQFVTAKRYEAAA